MNHKCKPLFTNVEWGRLLEIAEKYPKDAELFTKVFECLEEMAS